MQRSWKKLIGVTLIGFIVLYWLPFICIVFSARDQMVDSIDQLPVSDAVIVFGAHINEQNEVTPVLKERLEAGERILVEQKAKRIVVSNTAEAANVMASYLELQELSADVIEIDPHAVKTTDTCVFEKQQHPEGRSVVFVSQRFHLYRILYQCKKYGVTGVGLPAESVPSIDRSQYSWFTKATTRSERYIREAGLSWLSVLGLYK